MTLYAMQDPKGALLWFTLGATKRECWFNSFNDVAVKLGREWEMDYWKRERPSRKSAEQHGYRIVKVKLVRAR